MKPTVLPKSNLKDVSAVIPYSTICNDVLVSRGPDALTAVLEMHISYLDNAEIMQLRHTKLMELLCEMPDGAYSSLYYTKVFRQEEIPILGTHHVPIVNYIEEKRIRHLSSISSPTFTCYLAITIPVVKELEETQFTLLNKLFGKKQELIGNEHLEAAFAITLERLNTVIAKIITNIDGLVFRLSSDQLVQFLSLLLNHRFLDNPTGLDSILQGDFLSSIGPFFITNRPGYVYYGGQYHGVLSLRNAQKDSKLPKESHAGLNLIFSHEKLREIPFTIQHAIHSLSSSKGMLRAEMRHSFSEKRAGGAQYSSLSWFKKTPEGISPKELASLLEESMEVVRSTGHRFLEQHFHVHLWADTLPELRARMEHFANTVSKVYRLRKDKFNVKSAYFSLLPANEWRNTIRSTLPSFNIEDFLPIDMPRFSFPDKAKDFIYYHNTDNTLVRLSPFDTRADAWNFQVYGGTGSGKSMLVQDILWQYLPYNPQIAIIDYGGPGAGSYRNLVLNNQGTYLEIGFHDTELEFSINPFDGPYFTPKGEPDPTKATALLYTLERMAMRSAEDAFSGSIMYHLNEEIRNYYAEKDNNKDNSCNLNEFAQTHLRDNARIKDQGRDIFKEIFWFIGEGAEMGQYARFFRRTKELKNKDICCFDLEGLKNHQRLKDVLVPAILEGITNNILDPNNLERKKWIIMEEAHNALKGSANMQFGGKKEGDTGDFMVNAFATVRKLGACIGLVTQSISSLADSPFAKTIMQNTHYFYFVGNKHPHLPSDDSDRNYTPLRDVSVGSSFGTNRLSEYDINSILGCKSKRDFFLLTPFFSGLLRLYPSQEFLMASTTEARDKGILRRHMRELGHEFVTPEVIERAKHDFFQNR